MNIIDYLLYKKYYSWAELKRRSNSGNSLVSALFFLVLSLLGILVFGGLSYFLRFIFSL